MLKIRKFEFNPFQENTYVLYDETKECVVVDPGCYEKDEEEELDAFIKSEGLKVKVLLNTHCHVDHVLGNWYVKNRYGVKLLIHPSDEVVLRAVKVYAPNYGMHNYHDTEPDGFLKENELIRFGNQELKVLFVPGHAPGHVAFYDEKTRQLVSGDVLFYNSIGRTDLPGGNYETLISSIHRMIFTLPDDVVVYPGHGPETSVGFEKRTNPFCAIE
jgi:glyoxylase-like metal-dependent hydrolase (beta-lactamase superfamily II)